MTTQRTRRLILGVWTLAALISLGPTVGLGRYTFGKHTLACCVAFPETKADKLYLTVVPLVAFVIPLLVMIFVYLSIFVSMRTRTKRLQTTSSSASLLGGVSLQRRLLRTTLCSLCCFLLCWSPFCSLMIIAMVTKSPDNIPRGLGVASYWCGFSYTAINPIIFIGLSQRFRERLLPRTKSKSRK